MKNKNSLVKKSNSLNEAYIHLSLVEYRILQIAFASLVKEPINPELMKNCRFEISAKTYMELYNVDRNAAYQALREASERLFARYFSYWSKVSEDSNLVERVKSRWVTKITYQKEQAKIALYLSEDVLSMVGDLQEKYTYFHLYKISNLRSMYAVRMYELLVQWRKTNKVPTLRLNDLRSKLGVEDHEYNRIYNFKKKVLDVSVKQINEYTDIEVDYKQIKEGRNVVGFDFEFRQKEKNEVMKDVDVTLVTDLLTSKEQQIIKNKADEYIQSKQIIDKFHQQNIHKKALAEEWGLDEYREQQRQEEERKQAILAAEQAEKERQKKEEEERRKAEQELLQYEQKFLALDKPVQELILESLANSLGEFGKNFQEDLKINERAYCDVMYSATFKKIMQKF